jgi:integrase
LAAATPDAQLVFMRDGQRIGSFYKAWNSACDRAKLGWLLFHDFRRTGVRNLVRAGVTERVAMAISGHKTRAVFERYNIVSGRDLKDAANKLESYLAKQKVKKTRARRRDFWGQFGDRWTFKACCHQRALRQLIGSKVGAESGS